MNGKIVRCIRGGLAFSGFVVLDQKVMFELRGDLWSSRLNTASDFVWSKIKRLVESLPDVKLYEVRFVGSEDDWVPVAARSANDLASRIHMITGMPVIAFVGVVVIAIVKMALGI